jgi:hypothetical protein
MLFRTVISKFECSESKALTGQDCNCHKIPQTSFSIQIVFFNSALKRLRDLGRCKFQSSLRTGFRTKGPLRVRVIRGVEKGIHSLRDKAVGINHALLSVREPLLSITVDRSNVHRWAWGRNAGGRLSCAGMNKPIRRQQWSLQRSSSSCRWTTLQSN